MCFSANASFSAGVVLSVLGVACIKKTQHRSQLLFSSIPLIFGVQQIAEGILWVTLPNPDYAGLQKTATYFFLVFAQIVWPMWVPLAILLLEKNRTRKKVQWFLVGAGWLVAGYLAFCLINFPVQSQIAGKHIIYIQDYPPYWRVWSIVFYALATIIPPFFSHIKHMWLLGATILLSYILSTLFYEHYILSVWCFLSSIISLSIYFILTKISDPRPAEIRIRNSTL